MNWPGLATITTHKISQGPVLPSFSQLVTTLGELPPTPSTESQTISRSWDSSNTLHSPRSISSLAGRNNDGNFSKPYPSPVNNDLRSREYQSAQLHPETLSGDCQAKHTTASLPRNLESQRLPKLKFVPEDDAAAPRPAKRQRKDRNQHMNPHYTRDGNPRKRLAQACERCRAQKIKCRLQGAACMLCTRQGLQCKFAEKGYQSRNSKLRASVSTTSPARGLQARAASSDFTSPESRASCEAKDTETTASLRTPELLVSPEDSRSLLDMPEDRYPRKRQRSTSISDASLKSPGRHNRATHDLSIDVDPYLFDPRLCRHYVEFYFDKVNRSPYYLLPKTSFLQWISNSSKDLGEKIMLYALMAAGAIFSRHRDHETHRIMFARIARDGLKTYNHFFELPVVHALLILSTVSSHMGKLETARDDAVSAMRYAYGLQLNQESAYPPTNRLCSYVGNTQVAECCRRTFWLAFVKTTVCSMLFDDSSASPVLQGRLRMPGSDALYDAGGSAYAPLLTLTSDEDACVILLESDRPSSHLRLMIEAVCILKNSQQRHSTSRSTIAGFPKSEKTPDQQLRLWRRRRDSLLLNSPSLAPIELQIVDKCITMISLRYDPFDRPDIPETRDRYLQLRNTAIQLLDYSCSPPDDQAPVNNTHTSTDPFISCVVFTAFDIFTAAGLLSSVLDRRETDNNSHRTFMSLATQAITMMSERAQYSQLAGTQLEAMKKRLAAIMTQSNTKEAWLRRGFFFGEPLCASMRRKPDIVYDVARETIADALGLGFGDSGDMLEMRVPLQEGWE